jgi:hypothetical protein
MARRRADLAEIVKRLEPEQRVGLIEALTAFNEAGGEPPAPADDPEYQPPSWADVELGRGA